MKSCLFYLLTGLTPLLTARVMTLAWDASPGAEGYRVFRVGESLPIAETTDTRAEVELPPALQTLTVTAWNDNGESLPSEPLQIEPVTAPSPLFLQIDFSTDLNTWETITLQKIDQTKPRGFYRTRIIEFTPPAN